MDEGKLQLAGLEVWYELNWKLRKAEWDKLSCYEYVIFHLLDSTLRMFSEGDNLKRIKEYERLLKRWNDYVDYLKKTYEN